ncbi:DnaJ-domain-containing protein [Hypoxylon trugodes]|uniref:DnaJ-domain-containing protein n=1 Tax=Hypoxylon trugodes TaxID=326681 RepID=UPI00219B85B5|nr:DnaJ-domain-containing protein [Hypoxylon trugodes]KAI1389586.1 DnaJ-domain-containing protein [Hypoxylon trugodes]
MPLRHAATSASAVHPRRCLLYATTPFLLPIAPTTHRPFHGSAILRDEQIDNARNHYETLKLHPGATPAEIKKSFYTLSKTHHPDHNRTDPQASSRRFMRISEAYSILSIPAKRAAYDRDTLRLSSHHSHSHSHHHSGSYSSTNPAGGRPASGLSNRRRTAFRGPPPSFFRSGGWGAQSAKRRAAHEESTGTSSSSHSHSNTSQSNTSSSQSSSPFTHPHSPGGGMGPGQTPFHHSTDHEVPHFDRASHERTGRHHDQRRAARQAFYEDRQSNSIEPERGMTGMFFAIGGILVLSVMGPFMIGKMWRGTGGSGEGKRIRKEKEKPKSVTAQ